MFALGRLRILNPRRIRVLSKASRTSSTAFHFGIIFASAARGTFEHSNKSRSHGVPMIKRLVLSMVVAFLGLSMAVTSAMAGTLVQSTFDLGDEGWTVGDLFSAAGSPTLAPTW